MTIENIFSGSLNSVLTCGHCGFVSPTRENFNNISLPMSDLSGMKKYSTENRTPLTTPTHTPSQSPTMGQKPKNVVDTSNSSSGKGAPPKDKKEVSFVASLLDKRVERVKLNKNSAVRARGYQRSKNTQATTTHKKHIFKCNC